MGLFKRKRKASQGVLGALETAIQEEFNKGKTPEEIFSEPKEGTPEHESFKTFLTEQARRDFVWEEGEKKLLNFLDQREAGAVQQQIGQCVDGVFPPKDLEERLKSVLKDGATKQKIADSIAIYEEAMSIEE